MNDKLLENLN